MGRSISVRLANGRVWTKKGDASLHFSQMLGRYEVGDRVTDHSDHSDLIALLTVYDANMKGGMPTKAGVGVDYFLKGRDIEHGGATVCFFVVRKDGSRIDFSLGRALDAAGSATSAAGRSPGLR